MEKRLQKSTILPQGYCHVKLIFFRLEVNQIEEGWPEKVLPTLIFFYNMTNTTLYKFSTGIDRVDYASFAI